MSAEWTETNARKMAELHDILVPLVHQTRLQADALANLTEAEKHHLSYISKEQALIRSLAEMRYKNNAAIREEYGLVTSPEVRLAVRELAAEYENLKTQGIPLPRIWEAMEDKVKEALELTYEYGETASESIRKMAAEMKENGLPAFQAYLDKLDAGTGKLDELKDKLSGTYDVMTRQDVKDSFATILKDMNAMKEAGIPMERIWAAVGDKMKKTSEWAEDYGMGVSDGFREMNYELMNNGITALDTYIGKLGIEFTKKIDDLPGMLKPGMEAIKKQLGDELKGGFGEGYAEGAKMLTVEQLAIKNQLLAGAQDGLSQGFGKGFDDAKTLIDQFIIDIKEKRYEIPVVPDESVWWKFFDDIANGKRPDTGG